MASFAKDEKREAGLKQLNSFVTELKKLDEQVSLVEKLRTNDVLHRSRLVYKNEAEGREVKVMIDDAAVTIALSTTARNLARNIRELAKEHRIELDDSEKELVSKY